MISSLMIKLGIILWSCYKIKIREILGDFTFILIYDVKGRYRMFNNSSFTDIPPYKTTFLRRTPKVAPGTIHDIAMRMCTNK